MTKFWGIEVICFRTFFSMIKYLSFHNSEILSQNIICNLKRETIGNNCHWRLLFCCHLFWLLQNSLSWGAAKYVIGRRFAKPSLWHRLLSRFALFLTLLRTCRRFTFLLYDWLWREEHRCLCNKVRWHNDSCLVLSEQGQQMSANKRGFVWNLSARYRVRLIDARKTAKRLTFWIVWSGYLFCIWKKMLYLWNCGQS